MSDQKRPAGDEDDGYDEEEDDWDPHCLEGDYDEVDRRTGLYIEDDGQDGDDEDDEVQTGG